MSAGGPLSFSNLVNWNEADTPNWRGEARASFDVHQPLETATLSEGHRWVGNVPPVRYTRKITVARALFLQLNAAGLVQHLRIDFTVAGIATAGCFFQAAAIEDFDISAMVFNESLLLQGSGCCRDADSANAQHERKKLLSHFKAA
jgi:hypothetical protein